MLVLLSRIDTESVVELEDSLVINPRLELNPLVSISIRLSVNV